MTFKRGLAVYVILLLYGGIVWDAETGQMRHRPEWAQLGWLAFWAALALVGIYIATDTSEREPSEPRGWTEDEIRTNAWLEAHWSEWEHLYGLARYEAMNSALEEARAKGEV